MDIVHTQIINAINDVIEDLNMVLKYMSESERTSSILNRDVEDLRNIWNLAYDGEAFGNILTKVAELDTQPREAILTAFERHGLREMVEADGRFRYLSQLMESKDFNAVMEKRLVEVRLMDDFKMGSWNFKHSAWLVMTLAMDMGRDLTWPEWRDVGAAYKDMIGL